jgi:hypothetical protein
MVFDCGDEVRAVEVFESGDKVEVVVGRQGFAEDGIAFHQQLVDESEHIHAAKDREVNGQLTTF